MRQAVKHYNGFEITDEIIRKINLIELKRIQEKLTNINSEPIETLKDLCRLHGTMPKEENIILGTDWYIIYTKYEEDSEEIEINEWVAISNVENKLVQTMEMFKAIKDILLESKGTKVYATMRHSTSYKFYQSLLTREFLEEISNIPEMDDELPTHIEKIKNNLKNKYSSLEEYLSTKTIKNNIKQEIEDYIYHRVIFKTTNKFTKRYQK